MSSQTSVLNVIKWDQTVTKKYIFTSKTFKISNTMREAKHARGEGSYPVERLPSSRSPLAIAAQRQKKEKKNA